MAGATSETADIARRKGSLLPIGTARDEETPPRMRPPARSAWRANLLRDLATLAAEWRRRAVNRRIECLLMIRGRED